MRVRSTVERLDVSPGGTGTVPLEVVNTSTVIESLSVHALGVPDAVVTSEPSSLALFPEGQGDVTLTLALPDAFPAGTYPVTLVVAGSAPGAAEAYHDLDLVVPPHPKVTLDATPSVVRARGRAVFTVTVRNEGNLPLDVVLRATDTDRALRTTLTPSALAVPVGRSATSTVVVRGPRQLLGSDRDRPLTVTAQAPDTEDAVDLVLRQRSTFSRGLVTALVLLAVVVAWALAFLLGTRQVLGTDPYTKVAPASFFAAAAAAAPGSGGDGAAGAGGAGAAPAGALAKDGPLPAGVGATVTGMVRGAADQQGVGRVTVDALRRGRDGLVEVSSAATQGDGTYTLAGLFPGDYLLRVSADGYDPVWYPAAPDDGAATTVAARAQAVTDGIDLEVTGHPASISGHVDTGDTGADVEVDVTARPAWDGADPTVLYQTTAGADGAYTFTDLPAPGTYELSFVADGYQPTTLTERVLGGQERFALDVRLGAGTGQISGLVTDGSDPLGGVQVSTTMDGRPVVVGTPTIGQVGTFVVPGLTTPATYVLTFSKDGFGTRTVVVDLAAGQTRSDLRVALTGGAGAITGHVVDDGNAGLGGVAVTVGGSTAAASTTTLTAGDVGAFTLTGLPGAGEVTLTFTKDGYTPVSVPVTLSDAGPPAPVQVTLTSALGTVTGQVTRGGTGTPDLTVRATDGTTVRETTSTQGGAGGVGTYVLPDLPAGTYTVTVVDGETVLATAVVTVRPGATVVADLPVPGGG